MAEQEMKVIIGADIDSFQKSLKEVQDTMKDVSSKVQNAMDGAESSVSKSAGGISKSLKGIAGAIATAFAVDKIVDWGKTLLDVTADTEALESQYSQVMGDMEKDTDKYLSKMGKEWNKHPKELKSAYLQYVAILKSKGVEEKEAHKIAKDYLERTVDANAFANEDMADTTGRFMGAIKGEYDSLDTAMVNLNATMLDDLATKEYGKKFSELTVTQQEMLKTQEALRQHTSAGVFEQGINEADSYANNLAMVKNTWHEMLAGFGSPLLEIANTGLSKLSEILSDINANGFRNAMSDIIPSGFFDSIDTAKNFLSDFKSALSSQDWGMIGVVLGTGLGKAIDGIADLGQKLGDKIAEEFNKIDFVALVEEMKSGVKAFGISLAGMLNKDLQQAMSDGDWGEVGTILSEIIVDAIAKVGEKSQEIATTISTLMTNVMATIDWSTLGANAVVFASGFIIGFVSGLLDPATWVKIIAENWLPLLGIIIGLLFAPAKWLGKIGEALAKIPLVGKFLKWIWDGFQKLIEPVSTKIDEFFKNLGKNFTNGWKRAFDDGTVLGDWLKKIGTIWTNVKSFFATKLGDMNTTIQTWADKAGEKLAKPFKWMGDKAGELLGKVINKVKDVKKSVSGFVDDIKGFFTNLKLKIPDIKVPKMPTFKVYNWSWNPKDWISNPPRLGVKWNQAGAIVKGTKDGTVVGLAENHGDEAILPLSDKSRMKPFAQAVAGMMELKPTRENRDFGLDGGLEVNISIPIDGREIAKATVKFNQEELAKLQKKQNRLMGNYA